MNKYNPVISVQNASHYTWGDVCDGWKLISTDALSVIQERVPSGAAEKMHYHEKSQQFFYILSGTALFHLDGEEYRLKQHEGFRIDAGCVHSVKNAEDVDLEFIVISQPPSHGDRIDVG